MNLINVAQEFDSEEKCVEKVISMRWPDGIVRCLVCGGKEVGRLVRRGSAKNRRTITFQCRERTCKKQFSPTTGTIFHASHLPLVKWFMAIAFVMEAKKGVSALQLQRHLAIGSYESAWFMVHRIRRAMATGRLDEGAFGGGGRVVEVDETYLGGSAVRKFRKNPKPRAPKEMVLAIRERGVKGKDGKLVEGTGRVRFFHIPSARVASVKPILEANLQPSPGRIVTDTSAVYEKTFEKGEWKKAHRMVNHSREWVVKGSESGSGSGGKIHTNSVESSFSLLKRGIIGSFHWISPKHLHRYLSEFEYRFNRRGVKGGGLERFTQTLSRGLTQVGMRMEYRELIST